MAEFDFEESHVLFAWPAFVDLLAASVLVLLVLIAVVVVDARKEAGEGLKTWRRDLVAQLELAQSVSSSSFRVDTSAHPLDVRLVFAEEATFPRNKYTFDLLRPEAKTALNSISHILAKKGIYEYTKTIRVVGYTDTVPYRQQGIAFSNWELSAARAAAVARYLTESSSLNPCKVQAMGRGELYPIRLHPGGAAETTRSRRIEVWIEPFYKDTTTHDSLCWDRRKVPNPGEGGR